MGTLLLAVCLASCHDAGDEPAVRDIRRFAGEARRAAPGADRLGLALALAGKPLYAGGRAGGSVPSQPFTALACAILAGRGAANLDAPIARSVPGLKLPPRLDPQQLTLRVLLTLDADVENGPAELAARQVLEHVAGQPFDRVLAELIFTPLGMSQTRVDPEGGVATTPADLLRWLEANLRDGRIGTLQALSAGALEEAHELQATAPAERNGFLSRGFALGWSVGTLGADVMLFQPAPGPHVSFMPVRQAGVAVLAGPGPAGARVADLVAAYAYDRLRDKPGIDAEYAARLAALKKSSSAALTGGR